jgi:hypothetical protein
MHQNRKTWITILRSIGVNVLDVGGPAVSNQWILNKVIDKILQDDSFDYIIIQLTSIGKLDVEVNDERRRELVERDSVRNFTIGNVWPSSYSVDSYAKQMYQKWLSSPSLEVEDIYCKLRLLEHWCASHNKTLLVYQAYDIPWTSEQKINIANSTTWETQYKESDQYQWHDHANGNGVPCMQYQIELAKQIVLDLNLSLDKKTKIDKIKQHYTKETT